MQAFHTILLWSAMLTHSCESWGSSSWVGTCMFSLCSKHHPFSLCGPLGGSLGERDSTDAGGQTQSGTCSEITWTQVIFQFPRPPFVLLTSPPPPPWVFIVQRSCCSETVSSNFYSKHWAFSWAGVGRWAGWPGSWISWSWILKVSAGPGRER